MKPWPALLLVVALFAGCADDSVEATDGVAVREVQTEDDVGAISGVVVDETIRPIAGANVQLLGQEISTVSDEDGQFVFEGLEPGVYFLNVTAALFFGVQQSANVAAGSVASVRVLLSHDLSPQPYISTTHFQGFMRLYLSFASFAAEVIAPGSTGCECAFTHTPDPGARTFILEVYGEPSLASNPAPVYGDVYWELISQDNPDTEANEYEIHSSHDFYPVYVRNSVDGFPTDSVEWLVRLTGSQWFHLDESYDLFLTTFYIEDAPEDWKFNA